MKCHKNGVFIEFRSFEKFCCSELFYYLQDQSDIEATRNYVLIFIERRIHLSLSTLLDFIFQVRIRNSILCK